MTVEDGIIVGYSCGFSIILVMDLQRVMDRGREHNFVFKELLEDSSCVEKAPVSKAQLCIIFQPRLFLHYFFIDSLIIKKNIH